MGRYGTVVISKGAAHYHFYTEWDEPHEQTPDEFYADSFAELMSKIDAQ